MHTSPIAAADHQPGRAGRILRFPLVWTLAGIVGVGGVSALSSGGPPVLAAVGAVAAVAVYWAVMRYVARRSTPEIAKTRAGSLAFLGIGLGFLFIAVSMLIVITEFSFTWAPGSAVVTVMSIMAVQLGAAVTEELLFRGLLLQGLERLGGSWFALVSTAVLFGAIHLANPGATLWTGFAIAVEAGVLLGATFLWLRSIWAAVGLHLAWNTTVGLLGLPVSGHASPGLLVARPMGPELVTGGQFGIEGSIVPVVVSLLLAVPMLVAAHKRGNLVPMRRR
ncbi:CPBP family intramembrane glutamic endopeptidase [Amycolatopsis japonica]|uniref:CPBP family intramembrane glutamic endopeptidase n=1 Tax=Amycolatopsis japonica TaxID=208439 RepID=UPI00332A2DC6